MKFLVVLFNFFTNYVNKTKKIFFILKSATKIYMKRQNVENKIPVTFCKQTNKKTAYEKKIKSRFFYAYRQSKMPEKYVVNAPQLFLELRAQGGFHRKHAGSRNRWAGLPH